MIDFVFFTGMSLGSGISGKINTKFGYEAIYGSACILQILAMLYAIIFVKDTSKIKKETRENSETPLEKEEKSKKQATLSQIFSFKHIRESFGVAFKSRQGGVRHVILILISMFGLYTVANGISNINIQYARAKFEWTNGTDSFNEEWAQLQSIGTVFNLFAIGGLMPIMTQVLKLNDLSITAICVLSSMAGITTILLAENFMVLYLANFLRMFSDVVTVGIRSALTKIVGEKDIGKVFACVSKYKLLLFSKLPVKSANSSMHLILKEEKRRRK